MLLVGGLFLSFMAAIYVAATPHVADSQAQPSFEQKPSSQGLKDIGGGSLVRTKAAQVGAVKDAARSRNIKIQNEFSLPGNHALVTFEASRANVQSAMQSSPATMLQEIETFPNHAYRSTAAPNDPKYTNGTQWNLGKLKAEKAWDITTGSATTTIAVLDSGVLYEQSWGTEGPYTQPDMSQNRRWLNDGETGTTELGDTCWTGTAEDKRFNDCDDDGNGFKDDWRGWDFMGGFVGDEGCPNYKTGETADTYIEQDSDPQPYSCDSPDHPTELNKTHYDGTCTAFESACYIGHGTAVASVAAAATNNSTHIAGIDWNAQVMNLRIFDGYGHTTTARLVAAMEYADDMGADVTNLSLAIYDSEGSCDTTDKAFEQALKSAHARGVVSVAASGNGNKDYVCYPASSKYTIAVGATDKDDKRASFSNYGNRVDLVAPGVYTPALNAPSAYNNNEVYKPSGTSLSTPHVVGAASLVKSIDPGFGPERVRNLISYQASRVSGMNNKLYTNKYGYGRLNLHRTLKVASGEIPVYRLYNPHVKRHFYTKNANERNHVVNNLGFNYEGIGFWACTSSDTNTTPVYRLYHPGIKKHFFTRSSAERDKVVEDLGYSYEGVAWRSCDSGSKPVYRLYNHHARNHFYTKNTNERDDLVENHDFQDEGTGFWVK